MPKTRVFMISRMADDFDKDTLIRIQSAVTTLGADYLSSARFDPACTHVICLKPYHTEKFLACCASGRKVLHVNYVFDSLEAGRFLEVRKTLLDRSLGTQIQFFLSISGRRL